MPALDSRKILLRDGPKRAMSGWETLPLSRTTPKRTTQHCGAKPAAWRGEQLVPLPLCEDYRRGALAAPGASHRHKHIGLGLHKLELLFRRQLDHAQASPRPRVAKLL